MPSYGKRLRNIAENKKDMRERGFASTLTFIHRANILFLVEGEG